MAELTTDIGEEYLVEQQPNGDTIIFALYDDSTDTITETDDVAAVTTEPTGSGYSRQSSAVTTEQLSGSGNGDWGYDNDSLVTFDVSDSTETVDHVAYIVNFDSAVAGDGGTAADHLIAVDPLSQSRDLSNYDTIEFAAGDLEHKVD